jgi:hypothetical protein
MPVPPLLGFSTGHFILLFPLLAALPTLFLELQLSILSLSRFGSISPPNHLCSTQPYGKTSSRFLRSGIMEGLEAGQKRYRRPKSTKRSNPEPRDDTVAAVSTRRPKSLAWQAGLVGLCGVHLGQT